MIIDFCESIKLQIRNIIKIIVIILIIVIIITDELERLIFNKRFLRLFNKTIFLNDEYIEQKIQNKLTIIIQRLKHQFRKCSVFSYGLCKTNSFASLSLQN